MDGNRTGHSNEQQDNDFGDLNEAGAAESGAVGAEFVSFDPDLEAVVWAWPDLSADVRSEILALVQRAK